MTKATDTHIFREDGTLKGFTLSLCKPQRGTHYWRLSVQFDVRETKQHIYRQNVNNDFTAVFARAVEFAAKYWGVRKNSQMYQQMMASLEAHLVRYDLNLTVSHVTVVMQSLKRGKEAFDSEFIPRPSVLSTLSTVEVR